jgi:BirA family transcriptional regulator, biotin operon repressor / biotin---[acetyl-CoA-carboxylase] ligase
MKRTEVHAAAAHEPPRRRGVATGAPAALLVLLADGTEWSGSALANELGVTRAAVWKQIEQLRARGATIHAAAGRGYRLDAPIELLDGERIAAAISRDQRARVGAIDVHWQIDSTSSELARNAATASAPRACLAEIQTAGRGRRGRAWQMPLGGGIALSFLRRFEGGMATLAGLSLVAGIAVMHALADANVPRVALKWPNDVVADGKKLGGILVELGGDALGPCHAVIGIGINLRIDANHAIDQPWTDLARLTAGEVPSRNLIAGRILSRLAEAMETFSANGFSAFEREYAEYDALVGREIGVSARDRTWMGTAQGVTSRGALVVTRGKETLEIDSGEVSVRRVEPMVARVAKRA